MIRSEWLEQRLDWQISKPSRQNWIRLPIPPKYPSSLQFLFKLRLGVPDTGFYSTRRVGDRAFNPEFNPEGTTCVRWPRKDRELLSVVENSSLSDFPQAS